MSVTKNCLSQVLEDSGTGSDPDVTCLFKIFLERSISYVITQIRNCVKLLNLALYRSFWNHKNHVYKIESFI